MTEQDIELKVERITDKWDRLYMAGKISTEDYHREMMILDRWASQQYEALKPAPYREDFRNYS